MTRKPSIKAVPFYCLQDVYGAADFEKHLAEFVVRFNNPELSCTRVARLAANYHIPFDKVPIYHKAKFWESDFPQYRHASDEFNVLHSTPARKDTRGEHVPGRFDTVLINDGSGGSVGVNGTSL